MAKGKQAKPKKETKKELKKEEVFKPQPRLFAQVKYFAGDKLNELENEVNHWIADSESNRIEVKDIRHQLGERGLICIQCIYVQYPKED